MRALLRRDGRTLLFAGVVVGVGFEFKPQVGLVAVVLLGAVAALGTRWPLRSQHLWVGLVAALVLAAPYLVWQARPWLAAAHGRDQHRRSGRGRAGRFPAIPAGHGQPRSGSPGWCGRGDARACAVSATFATLTALYLIGNGKAYYLASLYPLLLGAGAIPTDAWLRAGRRRLRGGMLGAAVTVSAMISAVVALPLPPAGKLQDSATWR